MGGKHKNVDREHQVRVMTDNGNGTSIKFNVGIATQITLAAVYYFRFGKKWEYKFIDSWLTAQTSDTQLIICCERAGLQFLRSSAGQCRAQRRKKD